MAKKDNKNRLNLPRIGRIKDVIQGQINNLYSNTYFSPDELNKDITDVKNNINSSLEKIIKTSSDDISVNTSALYDRLRNNKINGDASDIGDSLDNLFNDKGIRDVLTPTLIENKLLKRYDDDIDTICKFMPSMQEALDIKKDHVFSADRYSKTFMTITNECLSDQNEISVFNDKMNGILKRYEIPKLFKSTYDKAAKYGEEYINICSYKKAFSRLLNNNAKFVKEEFISLKEYADTLNSGNMYNGSVDTTELDSNNNQIKIKFFNGFIPSVVTEAKQIRTITENVIMNEASFDTILDNDFNFEGPDIEDKASPVSKTKLKKDNVSSQDGLVNLVKEEDIKVNGAIVRRLKRENVVPAYIGDVCMGYYYVDCKGNSIDQLFDDDIGIKNTLGFLSTRGKSMFDVMKDANQSDALSMISAKLSNVIDKTFINNNQDLRKEIYMILKHNEIFNKSNVEIDVSYIPPQEMIAKMYTVDDDTHRGISDLDKGALTAKLCASLRTTSTIGMLTRGFDKRVFYVKQQVDTNTSQVLLNTINQLKKSNYGTREISNLKNLLNTTGRYNDLLVPVGASGDYPVQFEIMPGQDIDPKEEFCNNLEMQSVNSVGVPYEYVQGESQVDFAARLTMTNIKFYRNISARQEDEEYYDSQILQRIWDLENPDEKAIIKVKLNSPLYLAIVNNSEMYQYLMQYADNIVATEVLNDDDEMLKKVYKKNIIRSLIGNQLDQNKLDEIYKNSQMEVEKLKKKSEQQS